MMVDVAKILRMENPEDPCHKVTEETKDQGERIRKKK